MDFCRCPLMAFRDKEQKDQIEEIGSGLVNPPTDVHQLLLLLDKAESTLARVGQHPRQSTLTALRPSMKALISRDLFKHSNLDVRVAVTSCLSELTRVTAPDAPYDDELMKEIFELIVGSFKKLDEFSSRSFLKRVSILETIAKVRSCVLMLDLECDDLILNMFHHFLNTIRPQHSYTVTSSMETVMMLVIEESENISARLLSCLLDHLKVDDRASVQNVTPSARKLAEKVIVNCASKLKPYIVNWFDDARKLKGYRKIVAAVYHGNLGTVGRNEVNSAKTQEMKVVNSVKFKEEFDYESLCRKLAVQGGFLTSEMKRQEKHTDLEQKNMEQRLKECEISLVDAKGSLAIKEIHKLENLASQKLFANTTQMYEEKVMKLIIPLEAKDSQISNLEEQLMSVQHQSTDSNKSLEQQQKAMHELNLEVNDISMMNEEVACSIQSLELVKEEIWTEKGSLAKELKISQEKLLEEDEHRKSLEVENKLLAEDRVAYEPDLSKDRGNVIRPSSGLELIKNLPKSHKLREAVLGQRAIIAEIVALLKSEELNVQTKAIKMVANLVSKDFNQLRLVKEEGLDTLLLLLELSKDETIRRLTVDVVAKLAINGLNPDLIADKGGARLLASKSVQSDDPQTLWMVAWTIANFCGNERLHIGLKEYGGIKAPWSMARSHGLPTFMGSDRDTMCVSHFWRELLRLYGTKLCLSTAPHPHSEGQTESRNQSLETHLHCFVVDRSRLWSSWLPWAEYGYHISYQTTAKMTPFEIVYGRPLPALRDYEWGSAEGRESYKSSKLMIKSRWFPSTGSLSDETRVMKHCVNFQKIWSGEQENRSRCTLFPKQALDDGTVCSIGRPNCPNGYISVGDVTHIGNHSPHVAANYNESDERLSLSLGYDLVWRNCVNEYNSTLSFWLPRPLDGFVSVGCVAVADFEVPPLDVAYYISGTERQDQSITQSLVPGKGTLKKESTWVIEETFKEAYPGFPLVDKLVPKGGGDVMSRTLNYVNQKKHNHITRRVEPNMGSAPLVDQA